MSASPEQPPAAGSFLSEPTVVLEGTDQERAKFAHEMKQLRQRDCPSLSIGLGLHHTFILGQRG